MTTNDEPKRAKPDDPADGCAYYSAAAGRWFEPTRKPVECDTCNDDVPTAHTCPDCGRYGGDPSTD